MDCLLITKEGDHKNTIEPFIIIIIFFFWGGGGDSGFSDLPLHLAIKNDQSPGRF